jgi:hypothetical protein
MVTCSFIEEERHAAVVPPADEVLGVGATTISREPIDDQ